MYLNKIYGEKECGRFVKGDAAAHGYARVCVLANTSSDPKKKVAFQFEN